MHMPKMKRVNVTMLMATVTVAISLGTVACTEDPALDAGNQDSQNCNPGSRFDAYSTVDMLINDILTPAYTAFDLSLTRLNTAVQALPEQPTSADFMSLQTDFKATFLAWQRLDAFQLGPLGRSVDLKGGLGLRDIIYSFDSFRACTVDNNIVNQLYTNNSTFEDNLFDSTGLMAIEYLLYTNPDENSCASASPINRDGSFEALSSEERLSRRGAYLKALSGNLVSRFDIVQAAWGSFQEDALNAGIDSAHFPCPRDVLNDVYVALFYLERSVKDRKLGAPLGLFAPCEGEPCPEGVEAPYSRLGGMAAWENILIFEETFFADADHGFDAWLIDVGQDELVRILSEGFEDAKSACVFLNNNETDLSQMVTEEDTALQTCYDALSEFSRYFKTDVPAQLGLLPPMEAASDTD